MILQFLKETFKQDQDTTIQNVISFVSNMDFKSKEMKETQKFIDAIKASTPFKIQDLTIIKFTS